MAAIMQLERRIPDDIVIRSFDRLTERVPTHSDLILRSAACLRRVSKDRRLLGLRLLPSFETARKSAAPSG
jgi:hypothetical protein